jgi:hypothetical protein
VRLTVGVAAALVLIPAACGSSAPAHDSRIVLDRSIGVVTLREWRTDVERQLGRGTTVHGGKGHAHQVRYQKAGLTVVYAPGARQREGVFAILTTSARYRTSGGIGVGSSRSDVSRIGGIHCYSGQDCQHGAAYRKPGTAFFFRNGKVWRVAMANDFD